MALSGWSALKRKFISVPQPSSDLADFPVRVNLSQNCGTSSHDASDVFKELTPISTLDPYMSKNVLILNMEGVNGSTTFTDPYGHVFTAFDNASISTTKFRLGSSSAYFDGVNDYISTPSSIDFAFSGDFTVEMWIYPLAWNNNDSLFTVVATNGFQFGKHSTSAELGVARYGTAWDLYGGALPPVNIWSHVAVTRLNNTMNIWVNGVSVASGTVSASFAQGVLCIGATSGSSPFNGYIDSVRVTKGARRYHTTFQPPQQSFPSVDYSDDPNWANVLCALTFDGKQGEQFTHDLKGNNWVLYGNAKIDTTQSKFGGSSLYLDGADDYAYPYVMAPFDFVTTNKFVIEMWIFPTVGNKRICSAGGGAVAWNSTNGIHWLFQINSDNTLNFQYWNGSAAVGVNTTNKIILGRWNFIVVCVSGNTAYLSVDGIVDSFTLQTRVRPSTNPNFYLGTISGEGGSTWCYTGWIDSFKITLGVEKYTSNFIPPTITMHHTGTITPKKLAIELGTTGEQSFVEVETWDAVKKSAQLNFGSRDLLASSGNAYYIYYDASQQDNTGYTQDWYQSSVLALSFDSFTSGKGIFDYRGKQIPLAGNTNIVSGQSKFGVASAYFDGSGDYCTLPQSSDFAFGTGDFTIEFWINTGQTAQVYPGIFHFDRTAGQFAGQFTIYNAIGTQNLGLDYYNGSSWAGCNIGTFTLNTWHHVAFVRSGNSLLGFLDGVLIATTTTNLAGLSLGTSSRDIYIGWNKTDSAYYIGYLQDFRITKGVARYTANFTPPGTLVDSWKLLSTADPYWGNTVLYLPMQEANGTTKFRDYRNNLPVTVAGDSKHSSTQSKFGTTSLYLDGTGDTISVADCVELELGTDSFVIECWIYPNVNNTTMNICNKGSNENVNWGCLSLAMNSSGKLTAICNPQSGSNANQVSIIGTTTVTAGAWHHVAFARSGNTWVLFLDGLSVGSAISSVGFWDSTTPLYIGSSLVSSASSYFFNGYINDFRITRATSRYIQKDFTPGQVNTGDAYWSNTVLYLPMEGVAGNGTIVDSKAGKTVTPVGLARLANGGKYGLSSCYFGGGATDYLSIPTSSDFYLNGDFTIEAWFNASSFAANSHILGITDGTGNYEIRLHVAGQKVGGMIYHTSAYQVQIAGVTTLNTNQWYHVAFVRSGDNHYVFLDGVLEVSVVKAHTIPNRSWMCLIGQNETTAGATYAFNGYIDEVCIVKGQAKYAPLAKSFTTPASSLINMYKRNDQYWDSTVLYLPLDGSTGGLCQYDYKENVPTVNSYPQLSNNVTKFLNSSCFFDGIDDYLSYPASDKFGRAANIPYTIELWIYPLQYDGDLISMTKSASAGEELVKITAAGKLYFRRGTHAVSYTDVIITGTTAITLNVWHHVALTYNNGVFYLFLDGNLEGSGFDATYIGWYNSGYALEIGRSYNSVSPASTRYYKGYMSELKMTKGYCRWTNSFTPVLTSVFSGTQFSNSSGRSLLNFIGSDGSIPDRKDWQCPLANYPTIVGNRLAGSIFSTAITEPLCLLKGDFDIQVDINSTVTPSTNSWQHILKLVLPPEGSNSFMVLGRRYDTNNSGHIMWAERCISGAYTTVGQSSTTSQNCRFRYVRLGTTIYFYCMDLSVTNYAWTLLGSYAWTSADLYLVLRIDQWNSAPDSTAYFSNFKINYADNLTGYVGDLGTPAGREVYPYGYEGVYHLSQDPSGTIKDSTPYSRDLTTYGSMTVGSTAWDSRFGVYTQFDGSDDYMAAASQNMSAMQIAYTLESTHQFDLSKIWSKSIEVGAYSSGALYLSNYNNSAFLSVGVYNDDVQSTIPADNTAFNHYFVKMSGNVLTGGSGSVADNVNTNTISVATLTSTNIALNYDPAAKYLNKIKSVRLSNVSRSAPWLDYTKKQDLDQLLTITVPSQNASIVGSGGAIFGGSAQEYHYIGVPNLTTSMIGGAVLGGQAEVHSMMDNVTLMYEDKRRRDLLITQFVLYGYNTDPLFLDLLPKSSNIDIWQTILPSKGNPYWNGCYSYVHNHSFLFFGLCVDTSPIDMIHWDNTGILSPDPMEYWHQSLELFMRLR